jgi:hypothetical protein
VILYAAKLAQFQEKVLTKPGIKDLIHDMIKKNQDRSLVNELRKEITRLMLALSQKYSSECFDDPLAVYPSLFDSINDDSSESGYTSSQLTSPTIDTADSDWQLSRKKTCRTRSSQPVSDTDVSQSTANQDADNYTSDSASQGSNNQESNHRNANASENHDNSMESGEEDADGGDNQQFKG